MKPNAYRQLKILFEDIALLDDSMAILHWDQATFMPSAAANGRARQLATLATIQHRQLTDSQIGDLLDQAEDSYSDLDPWQQANLRHMRRIWQQNICLPSNLVKSLQLARQDCEMCWRQARQDSDFSLVKDSFAHLLSLVRQSAKHRSKAHHKSAAPSTTPYEALLDLYEPGLDVMTLDRLFGDIGEFLPNLLERILSQPKPQSIIPSQSFAPAAQKDLGQYMMRCLGLNHIRLDISHHPFCGGACDDVRITTRYNREDFTQSLMGVLHESGHALYDQGLPEQHRYQPVGQACGMAMHESQSLTIEMQAGRSDAFLHFSIPHMRRFLQKKDQDNPFWHNDNIKSLYRRVQRSLIRVNADEVTYPLHILLRYRLEKALIEDDLPLSQLSTAWHDLSKSLLGITPENDAQGCLQDIHWYEGAFGYFPTYTLGAVIAAQLFATAIDQIDNLETHLSEGDFRPLIRWLGKNVHGHGSRFSTAQIVKKATGRALDSTSFQQHLKRRYLCA